MLYLLYIFFFWKKLKRQTNPKKQVSEEANERKIECRFLMTIPQECVYKYYT